MLQTHEPLIKNNTIDELRDLEKNPPTSIYYMSDNIDENSVNLGVFVDSFAASYPKA